jgi:hypothetical protein
MRRVQRSAEQGVCEGTEPSTIVPGQFQHVETERLYEQRLAEPNQYRASSRRVRGALLEQGLGNGFERERRRDAPPIDGDEGRNAGQKWVSEGVFEVNSDRNERHGLRGWTGCGESTRNPPIYDQEVTSSQRSLPQRFVRQDGAPSGLQDV